MTMLNLSYIIQDMKTNTNPLDNVIIWNKKKYVMPFDADYGRQKADTFKEEIIVKNRFSGEPALLPWFAVAVYDTLMGAEQLGDNDTLRKGLDWFQKYFTEQYYVLLD